MKCGFYESDITPPFGSIIPGDFAARYAKSVLDKLFVRTVAIKNGDMSLALAVIDACGITMDIAEKIKQRVTEIIPLQNEQIMVMATHAHGGGPTLNWGEEVVTDSDYLEMLIKKAADAIVSAWQNAEESEIFAGSEELFGVSFIRIYKMKDGSLKTNPDRENTDKIDSPTTEIDPEVSVLCVKQNGKAKGAVVNFATHPATIATDEITGDYISVLSRELKKIYGEDFVCVFINGACGNINHINPFDENTYRDNYVAYKNVGRKLAETVKKVIENAEIMQDNNLKATDETIKVKLRKPSKEDLLHAKEVFDDLGDSLEKSVPNTDNYMETFFALQAFLIQADKRTQRDIYLQVFRVGKCYIFGTPCQLFVQFGKQMKAHCKGLGFVSAFANDYCGYVPTPECMKEGVYEARLAPTSALEPSAGDKVTEKVIEMYNRICD